MHLVFKGIAPLLAKVLVQSIECIVDHIRY